MSSIWHFRHLFCALVTFGVVGSVSTESSVGQTANIWTPDAVLVGETIAVYADWSGRHVVDGILIETGGAWQVLAVEAVDATRLRRTNFRLRGTISNTTAEANRRIVGKQRFVILLESLSSSSAGEIQVSPAAFVADIAGQRLEPIRGSAFEVPVAAQYSRSAGNGLALHLNEHLFDGVSLIDLDIDRETDGLTFEFWLRTVDRDRIIASTWSGQDQDDYPFELVVDAKGEFRAFSGNDGLHRSLGSGRPVADGAWHHVAFAIDFSDGTSRLVIDGVGADSMTTGIRTPPDNINLMLGGRDGDRNDPARNNRTTLIDEVQVWSLARSTATIARDMRLPVSGSDETGRFAGFSFDDPSSNTLPEIDVERDLVSSNIMLHVAASEVGASVAPGLIKIDWTITRAEAQFITIERSYDGSRFEPVYVTQLLPAAAPPSNTAQHFSFEDVLDGREGVAFYRIVQSFADDSQLVSKMMKVGLGGQDETPSKIDLVGNSPNPFSTSTRIYFRLLEPRHVDLSIWSISGHLVADLVHSVREPGLHHVQFDATALPSGTYFIRLESELGVQTETMIVQR